MSRIKPQKVRGYKPKSRVYGKHRGKVKPLEVKKVMEQTVKDTAQLQTKRKPAIEYSRLGLPRITGRGAKIAHKQWLEENGYERD